MSIDSSRVERFNFQMPGELVDKTKKLAEKLQESVSEFIRVAIQNRIEAEEKKQLEKLLIEGYKANYEYYKKESKEFKYLDS